MNRFKKNFVFCLVFSLGLTPFFLKAQHQHQFGLRATLFSYIDNREYKAPMTEDKTLLATRLSPSLFYSLDNKHFIYAGTHYQHNFGNVKNGQLKPILYYKYQTKKVNFYFGHTPREEAVGNLHPILLSDTVYYTRPNLEGMLVELKNKNYFQKIYIDWTGEQSTEIREQFFAGSSGEVKFGDFNLKNDILLWHYALQLDAPESQHIRDNAVAMLRAGYKKEGALNLDLIDIDAGLVVGMDRWRSEYDFIFPKGFISNIYAGYKSFAVRNTTYIGEAQRLPNADSYYNYKRYNRLDFLWRPFKSRFIEGELNLSFHSVPGYIDNQQSFKLKFNLNTVFLNKSFQGDEKPLCPHKKQ